MLDKAKAFLYTEEYDFRERELYDCTEDLSEDFVSDWCLPADYDEAEANDRGYFWDDNFDLFTNISESWD